MLRLTPLVEGAFALLLGLLIAAAPATAQSGAARPASHKVPMHPSTLTLRSGAHGERRHRHHDYAHHTFRQPTPIHGTMAGPRI